MSDKLIDAAGQVRAGEEVDVARVSAYLRAAGLQLDGEPVLTQFPGGASNLTYQLSYANKDVILRRPPFGHIAKSAHDVVREAQIMKALRPVYPAVPEIYAICEDVDVIGAPFYVMARLVGVIPRQNLPKALNLDAAATRQLCLNVLDKLIDLHVLDPKSAGLDQLGKGEGYVARQVDGWSKRFRAARTEDVSDFESVMHWLAEKQPRQEVAIRLIHNDFRFDNVVLDQHDPLKVIGVLDWEMATLGDPLMDLGSSLAYWVQADDDAFSVQAGVWPTLISTRCTACSAWRASCSRSTSASKRAMRATRCSPPLGRLPTTWGSAVSASLRSQLCDGLNWLGQAPGSDACTVVAIRRSKRQGHSDRCEHQVPRGGHARCPDAHQ